MFESNCEFWSDSPCIISKKPQNRRNGLYVFEYNTLIVVVSNTFRFTKGMCIYEIIWCGKLVNERLVPASFFSDYKEALTAITNFHTFNGGILFGSSSPLGGGIAPDWSSHGWIYGQSGAHAWYIYNFMPPTFRNCVIHCIRDEL
jgi:hypothetical protein